MIDMNNFEKYEKTYFMPPVVTYDWVKKTEIEKPPVWLPFPIPAVLYFFLFFTPNAAD